MREELREQLGPPAELNGEDVVREEKRQLLCLVGFQSFTQRVGRLLGGHDPATQDAWDEFKKSKHYRDEARRHIMLKELMLASEDEARKVKEMLDVFISPDEEPRGLVTCTL